MLKRLNRLWKLSKKDPKTFKLVQDKNTGRFIPVVDLTDEQINKLPNAGDGNTVFIGEGTVEEHEDFEKEQKGLKGIFGL